MNIPKDHGVPKPAEASSWHFRPRAAGRAYVAVYLDQLPSVGRDEAHRRSLLVADMVNCGGGDIVDTDTIQNLDMITSIIPGRVVQVADRVKVERTEGREPVIQSRPRGPLPPYADETGQLQKWLDRARSTGHGSLGEHPRNVV